VRAGSRRCTYTNAKLPRAAAATIPTILIVIASAPLFPPPLAGLEDEDGLAVPVELPPPPIATGCPAVLQASV